MMSYRSRTLWLFVLLTLLSLLLASAVTTSTAQEDGAAADGAQIHAYAVLFHSHGCPHCVDYIENRLPQLEAEFGDQLTVVLVSIDDLAGRDLAMNTYTYYNVPQNDWVVPMMVVNDNILIGGSEIPARASGIVRDGLAAGGINLPDVDGMTDYYQARYGNIVRAADASTLNQAEVAGDTIMARLAADPVANGLAVAVLVALLISFFLAPLKQLEKYRAYVVTGIMVLVIAVGASLLLEGGDDALASASALVVLGASIVVVIIGTMLRDRMQLLPMVAVAGLLAAVYLAYVEVAHAEAACGIVGNCNAVQQSPYATLFGILPVGVLGVGGYLAILGLFFLRDRIPQANQLLQIFAAIGVAFSAYLTFLEPFVIGATCMWCITSALTMLATWWIVAPIWQPNAVSELGGDMEAVTE